MAPALIAYCTSRTKSLVAMAHSTPFKSPETATPSTAYVCTTKENDGVQTFPKTFPSYGLETVATPLHH